MRSFDLRWTLKDIAAKLVIVGVRCDDKWLQTLERWIEENGPTMSRPEAIRRLVELGLSLQRVSSTLNRKKVMAQDWAHEAPASLTVGRSKRNHPSIRGRLTVKR